MLPDNLASSYEQYKAATSIVLSWLNATAISCGYTVPRNLTNNDKIPSDPSKAQVTAQVTTARLKGKARKEAKASMKSKSAPDLEKIETKQVVTTKQVLKQAEAIARSSKVVPIAIQRLFQDAIKARMRCTAWFTSTDTMDNLSNSQHQYFTRTLQEAFEMLKPRFEIDSSCPKVDKPIDEEQDNKSINRFGSLHIEELDEELYESLPLAAQPTKHAEIQLEIDPDTDLPCKSPLPLRILLPLRIHFSVVLFVHI